MQSLKDINEDMDVRITLKDNDVCINGKRISSISSLLMKLSRPSDSGFIPSGVKLMRQTPNNRVVVVHEMPPRVARMSWPADINDIEDGDDKELSLSLPYVITIMDMQKMGCGGVLGNNVYVFFRNKPLISLNDELYIAALHNVSGLKDNSGLVCMGDDFDNTMYHSMPQAIRGTLLNFWETSFNQEFRDSSGWSKSAKRHSVAGIAPVEKWAAKSIKNPRFGSTRKWIATGYTLGKFLNDFYPNNKQSNISDLVNLVHKHGEKVRLRRKFPVGTYPSNYWVD